MAKSNDPLPWSLFAAGGMVAALFTPITVILVGFAVLAGWVTEDQFYTLLHHPLTRLYLFIVIFLPLFHGAHRTLLTLVDMGLKGMRPLLAVLLYGAALVGTVWSAVLLVKL
jgi:fumarate reductase subunit D